MSNKASEPNTSGAPNTSDGTANAHEPQNLLDATPRTGSIPLHLGESGADSGKTQPEKSLNRRILALAVPAFGAPIAVTCYEDLSGPRPAHLSMPPVAKRERGTGRPTKKERRALDELRGRKG